MWLLRCHDGPHPRVGIYDHNRDVMLLQGGLGIERTGQACDNANCESFFRTLKREEVYAKECKDLEDLRHNISEFIECYYNRERLHSALGYRSPREFEEAIEFSDAASISSVTKLNIATMA